MVHTVNLRDTTLSSLVRHLLQIIRYMHVCLSPLRRRAAWSIVERASSRGGSAGESHER